jgi:NTE family protein
MKTENPLGLTGKIGLALGSGAAKGWAHIGVIRGLREAGIEPTIVCGTSMGGVVGAAYAAGELEAFEEWGRAIEWRQLVTYFDLTLRGGLIRARRMFEFFENVLPDRTIESLDYSFAAIATDLGTGQEIWLRKGPLLDSLRATIALPGLIAPVKHKDRWLVDGGLVNPVPVSACRALGADSVIAVDLNSTLLGRRVQGVNNVPEVAAAELQPISPPASPVKGEDDSAIGRRIGGVVRGLAGDLRERLTSEASDERKDSPTLYEVVANSINIMQVRIGRSRMAGDPPDLFIAPRMNDFGLLDFDRAEEAIANGYEATVKALHLSTSG